ncbi:MAG: hypothetical protein VW875_00345 [Planctomycetaceae bacterium]
MNRPQVGSFGEVVYQDIDIERVLMITDLKVVEHPIYTDPKSPAPYWTFKHLMTQMSGKVPPSKFVENWLNQWLEDQTVGHGVAVARSAMNDLIIAPWRKASGGGKLDLNKAPFKLLAIVNRMDLRSVDGTEVRSAGEGRLVFGTLDSEGKPLGRGFYIIFEYNLAASNLHELNQWARKWERLQAHPIESRRYSDELSKITRSFTDRQLGPDKHSFHLNQVRTNEVALGRPWELREFKIIQDQPTLTQVPVAGTPDFEFFNNTKQGRQTLGAILQLMDGLPDSILGSSAPTPFGVPWKPANVTSDQRHQFALFTCSGCHHTETDALFTHIAFPEDNNLPDSLGNQAALSGFLTGIKVKDPLDDSITRKFNDLERRQIDFAELLNDTRKGRMPSDGEKRKH